MVTPDMRLMMHPHALPVLRAISSDGVLCGGGVLALQHREAVIGRGDAGLLSSRRRSATPAALRS